MIGGRIPAAAAISTNAVFQRSGPGDGRGNSGKMALPGRCEEAETAAKRRPLDPTFWGSGYCRIGLLFHNFHTICRRRPAAHLQGWAIPSHVITVSLLNRAPAPPSPGRSCTAASNPVPSSGAVRIPSSPHTRSTRRQLTRRLGVCKHSPSLLQRVGG
jgi:hypothetical protein